MPQSISVRDGAAIRSIANVWARDAVAWRQAQKVWVHDGAAWRQVYNRLTLNTGNIGIENVSGSIGIRTASLVFVTTGALSGPNLSGSANWATPNSVGLGGGFWVRVAEVSSPGATRTGGFTLGSWNQINVDQSIVWSNDVSNQLGMVNATVSISNDGGATTLVSFTCNVQVGYQAP